MASVAAVRVPGDKSISHRAWILAALAEGSSRLRGLLDSADVRATAAAVAALGVRSEADGEAVVVHGVGLGGLRPDGRTLDCGNSGTTARLLLGVLAGTPGEAVLTGDDSLRARPMRRVTSPLASAGAEFTELEGADRLPIRVRGTRPLRAVRHASPHASAQVKSALLLAGLCGRARAVVTEPGLSRDHTERLLRLMGADVLTEEAAGRVVHRLEPVDRLDPLDLQVPGDVSSAVFFLALGALLGPVRVEAVGLNPTRTGALDVLTRMGARLRKAPAQADGEPVGAVATEPGPLRGTVVEAAEVPALLDEVPILGALAARADGVTEFRGIGELRVKETDRIATIAGNLRRLGIAVEEGDDRLAVRGSPDARLTGTVDSHGDHRIAMAFGVLGALPGNEIEVTGREAVDVSFPGFWSELERVRKELGGT